MKLISRLIVIFFILGLIAVCLPQKVLAVSSDEEIASLMLKAMRGDAAAQYNLGIMYDKGEEVPHDSKKAFYWYKKAAEQGVAEAQYNVAVMYGRGVEGVLHDLEQEAYRYKKAPELGIAKAQYDFDVMYGRGDDGVPKDSNQAEHWNKKAAEQIDNLAQSRIAEGYHERFQMYGNRYYYNNAVDWYEKAAEQGNCSAQYTLGEMYREGKGVPRDYVMAYAWFNTIASSDWSSFKLRAEKSRDEIGEMMSQDQIEEAKKLSKELYEKTNNEAK